MALSRGVSINPAANTDALLLYSSASVLCAVVASNLSESKETKIRVWVEPYEYYPIDPGDEDLYRAYLIKDGVLPPGGSYESWRIALNVEDRIYCSSNNGKASFTLEVVIQSTPTPP